MQRKVSAMSDCLSNCGENRARMRAVKPPTVGVLAVQGDFAAHANALERLGCRTIEVRRPDDLSAIDGLILPGGESTTLIRLLRIFDLWEPIRALAAAGMPIFGTCAGLILLAQRVENPPQESLALLPVDVMRNAYGRQVDSFVATGEVRVPADLAGLQECVQEAEFIFIRAPRITALHDGVETLASWDGSPVLVRKDNLLAATFHPELARDCAAERIFVAMVIRARDATAVRSGKCD